MTLDRHGRFKPIDGDQPKALRQRRALLGARLELQRLCSDLPLVDQARELGRDHSAISPASSSLLSSAEIFS